MRRFAHPPGRRKTISYLTVADNWQQWGWQVTLERPEVGFSHLRQAGKRGFVLTGTGRARVRPPAVYSPGATVLVSMRGRAGLTEQEMTASRKGGLRIVVPLSNGQAPGTTRVTIRPMP